MRALASLLSTVAVVTAFAGRVEAQGDTGGTGEGTSPDTTTEPAPTPLPDAPAGDMPAPPVEPAASPNAPRFGVGVSLRRVVIPQALLEVFVEQAPSGIDGTGFRVEVYRRRGDFELQLGLEYEGLHGEPGIWVESGDRPGPPPGGDGDEVDFVEFDDFGWFTIEMTFLNHTKLSKIFALRYGGGAGLGILKGDVRRTDFACSVATLDRETLAANCAYAGGPNNQTPYDLPPVFPVINGFFGVEIRPIDNLVIHVETGIRTIPFFGATVGYFF
jgi:hypothetical protein